jgi:hypothetical protein
VIWHGSCGCLGATDVARADRGDAADRLDQRAGCREAPARLTNAGGEPISRSVAEILRANILTRFNFILGVLLAVILVFGQPQNALFGVVLVTNALIGIAQELRAPSARSTGSRCSPPRVSA